MNLDVKLRAACADDVEQLIDLMIISSWGGMKGAWERVAPANTDWRTQARGELLDLNCDLGFNNFAVATVDDKIAGMMVVNFFEGMDHIKPEQASDDLRETLTLLKKAAYSIFIREIAVAEWARGQGVGNSLIAFAEKVWRNNKKDRISLFVNSENIQAKRIYEARGFIETSTAPNKNHPSFSDKSFKLLMEKRKSWEADGAKDGQPASAEAQSSR